MSSFFDIPSELLERLDETQAVFFFRDILWAEAAKEGIPLDQVHISERTKVCDGGIDALVNDATTDNSSWIKSGTTGYQIKAGNISPEECKRELHEGSDKQRPIKPKIKELLENGGYYTIVSFSDLSGNKRADRLTALKSELDNYGIPSDKVDIYDATKIKSFAERYPALVLQINLPPNSACVDFNTWAKMKRIQTPQHFVLDARRSELMEQLRLTLRNRDGQVKIIRISGTAGIGKTRFVHEVLDEDDLRSQTLYIEDGERSDVETLLTKLQTDSSLSGIVVIDDLSRRKHTSIEDKFGALTDRQLSIITLSTDWTSFREPTIFEPLTVLDNEKIKELLQLETAGGLTNMVIDRIVRFADGYPRFAILLAEQYRRAGVEKDELLDGTTDRSLFERLIAGEYAIDSHAYLQTKKALMWISIFSKVGYNGSVKAESEWLAEKAGLSISDFRQIITEQKERGLIQGNSYITLTPAILSIWLLREWWKINGIEDAQSFNEFIESIPEEIRPQILSHMAENLRYIGASNAGLELSKSLLKPDGIVTDLRTVAPDLGKTFFLRLTEANPEAALRYMEAQLENKTSEDLSKDKNDRRMMVWALEMIVAWEHLFDDASRLLLRLAVAENETCSNNATGIFVSLFSTVYAPTQAPYSTRLDLLQSLMKSDSKEEEKLIGIKACEIAFSTTATRVLGVEEQGIKKTLIFPRPETRAELVEIHTVCWGLLNDIACTDTDQNLVEEALQVMLHNSRTLIRPQELRSLVFEAFETIIENGAYRKEVLAQIISILHYDSKELDSETVRKLEEMREKIIGASFQGRLERYVGMDLIEDRMDRRHGTTDVTQQELDALAKEVAQDRKLYDENREWLLSAKAVKGHQFGRQIASFDTDFSLLPDILRSISSAESLMFPCGYLSYIFEHDQTLWEKTIKSVHDDLDAKKRYPEVIFRSGVNEVSFSYLIEMIDNEEVDPKQLWFFTYGLSLSSLPEHSFLEWLEKLKKLNSKEATIIALSTYDYYFLNKSEGAEKKTPPRDITLSLIVHPTLLDKKDVSRYQMDSFYWKEVTDAFIEEHPDTAVEIAEKLIVSLDNERTFVDQNEDDVTSVLYTIAEKYPKEVWSIVEKYLGPPLDKRSFVLREWLKGGSFMARRNGGPALNLFEPKDFWGWVDQNVEERAWYAANLIPKWLSHTDDYCWAKELLTKYGDREDVRNNYSANYSTEGWSGPASEHYKKKKQALEEYAKNETDANVLRWIREYTSGLDRQIEGALVEEENRGF